MDTVSGQVFWGQRAALTGDTEEKQTQGHTRPCHAAATGLGGV